LPKHYRYKNNFKLNLNLPFLQTCVSISAILKIESLMKSIVSKRILSETSNETKQKAVEYGEKRKNCKHPREQRSYIGKNLLRCNVCGLEFS
jgi:hypothetical protein